MRKYEKIKYGFILWNISATRVPWGWSWVISQSILSYFPVVLHLWAAGIYYLGNEFLSLSSNLIYLWTVYSIDTNHFYAKLICSARENIFRWLCWILEPVKLIIPAFSYQIGGCSILVPCRPSGVDVFLSRERKKIQFLSLSALVLQEMQRREMWSLRISAEREKRIYREGENQLQNAIPWGVPDSIDFWYLRL